MQWRSEVGQGGGRWTGGKEQGKAGTGGRVVAVPRRSPEGGGGEILSNNFLKFINGEIFKNLKEQNKMYSHFLFENILDFSSTPPPPHHLTKLVTIFLYI